MTRIWNKHKQTNTPLKIKVFVAMSGGVDSSVAALLLKNRVMIWSVVISRAGILRAWFAAGEKTAGTR